MLEREIKDATLGGLGLKCANCEVDEVTEHWGRKLRNWKRSFYAEENRSIYFLVEERKLCGN